MMVSLTYQYWGSSLLLIFSRGSDPEGVRVVGLTERAAAVKELVNAIESLRAKAANHIPKTPVQQHESSRLEAEVEEGVFKKVKNFHWFPFKPKA